VEIQKENKKDITWGTKTEFATDQEERSRRKCVTLHPKSVGEAEGGRVAGEREDCWSDLQIKVSLVSCC